MILLEAATGGAVQLSSAQMYAIVAALAGVIASGAALIRHLYETRLGDRDRDVRDRDATIAKLEAKLERYEQRDQERAKVNEQAVASMQTVAAIADRQGQFIEQKLNEFGADLADLKTAPARRRSP